MEDKYYIPDISEFYVGFECEQYSSVLDHEEWKPYIVTAKTWSSNGMWKMYHNEPNSFRVKYLDRKDIEDLNFYYEKTYPGLDEDLFYYKTVSTVYYLEYDYITKYLRMYFSNPEEPSGDISIFSGIIKNKSELKKLLKQLNIK